MTRTPVLARTREELSDLLAGPRRNGEAVVIDGGTKPR